GNSNVIGSLNKPFTSDLLIKTVESHMPESSENPEAPAPETPAAPQGLADFGAPQAMEPETNVAAPEPTPAPTPAPVDAPAAEEWWSAPPSQETFAPQPAATPAPASVANDLLPLEPATPATPLAPEAAGPDESLTGGTYFCGDTSFFSHNWALQTIAKNKLTGTLRSFWSHQAVELLVRNGEILLATSRDPQTYCSE